MKITDKLVDTLIHLKKPAVIAVSGFNGSGKSTFAGLLHAALRIPVISVDSFIKSRMLEKYSYINLIDIDRLEREVIIPFKQNKNPLMYGHFDWPENRIKETIEVVHNGTIIVEGIWIFRQELMRYFDYTIWIDCDMEEAVRRGKKRDREVYHNPQDEQWDTFWKENDKEFFRTVNPKQSADIVIDNTTLYFPPVQIS